MTLEQKLVFCERARNVALLGVQFTESFKALLDEASYMNISKEIADDDFAGTRHVGLTVADFVAMLQAGDGLIKSLPTEVAGAIYRLR